jgi:5,6-dimethylbenzimidazole synthase
MAWRSTLFPLSLIESLSELPTPRLHRPHVVAGQAYLPGSATIQPGHSETNMQDFTPQETAAVYRVIAMRRDMRHFLPDALDDALPQRLLAAAHMAPSVGLMQPWRFIRLRDRELRTGIHTLVEAERVATAHALGERDAEFMRLKVEAIRQCGEVLVVGLADHRESHIFGRRTMPDMDLASVACAIQNLWLAARAENVGMGWVSLFDLEALRLLLRMPPGSRPIAVLCLGHVPAFYERPMLEETQWAHRLDLNTMVHTDYWHDAAPASTLDTDHC